MCDLRTIDRYLSGRYRRPADATGPAVTCQPTLRQAEWRDLLAEDRRRSRFWPGVITAAAITILAGLPVSHLWGPAAGLLTTCLGALGLLAYTVAYTTLGPLLAGRRLTPLELTARWRIDAGGLDVQRPHSVVSVSWSEVSRLVITEHLIVVHLRGRRGGGQVFGLPRRAVSEDSEMLVRRWAGNGGARLVQRAAH